MSVTVLGAGAWGTALACSVAASQPVCLWARDAAQAQTIERDRENRRYLPGAVLPASLRVTADWQEAVAHGRDGVYVVATPMAGLREMLVALPDDGCVWWLCKGFEKGTGALGHEIAREVAPHMRVGVLSGPSFAQEVARGQPTALVAASVDADLAQQAIDAFHGDNLRVYTSDDPVGVEVGGAVKNVLAIATGIADGLSLGLNARAALITRGLAEITRLGGALGARPETFMGLSGLGDLVLTCTGDLSRNRQVGLRLASGLTLDEVLKALGHVAEGVYSARTVLDRAVSLGVDMPLTDAVVAVLDGRLTPQQAVVELMRREPKPELT